MKIGLESGIAPEMDKRNNLQRRLWLDVMQSICMLMCYIQVNRYASTCGYTHAETHGIKRATLPARSVCGLELYTVATEK